MESVDNEVYNINCRLTKMQEEFDRANKTLYCMDGKIDTIIGLLAEQVGRDGMMDRKTCAMMERIARMDRGIEKMTNLMEFWES